MGRINESSKFRLPNFHLLETWSRCTEFTRNMDSLRTWPTRCAAQARILLAKAHGQRISSVCACAAPGPLPARLDPAAAATPPTLGHPQLAAPLTDSQRPLGGGGPGATRCETCWTAAGRRRARRTRAKIVHEQGMSSVRAGAVPSLPLTRRDLAAAVTPLLLRQLRRQRRAHAHAFLAARMR